MIHKKHAHALPTFIASSLAICGLNAADIVFTGYSADGGDGLSAVALVNIPAGRNYILTDKNWNGSSFESGEGAVTWSVENSIPRGSIICFNNTRSSTGFNVTEGTIGPINNVASKLSFGTSGDAAFLLEGSLSNPSFVSGISTAPSTNIANTGLNTASSFVSFTGREDFIEYQGNRNTGGSFSSYAALVSDTSNWVVADTSNDDSMVFDKTGFGGTVTDPGNPNLPSFRFASSSNRIYVTGPGTCTLSDIRQALPLAPLELVDPNNSIWHLRSNLIIEAGARLKLHGSTINGDVDELRMQSNNTGQANAFVEIRADYGRIEMYATTIHSWDDARNGPDLEPNQSQALNPNYVQKGRAFIRARSRWENGQALESSMDIWESEISYLGYQGAEAYGLSWKVMGFDGTNFGIFNAINIYGNIRSSDIHHNHFGQYSFGLEGGFFENNRIYDNNIYGLDPHDDSDNITIRNNDVWGNGTHGIIASKRCDNIAITNNRSFRNGGNGIMLHRSSNNSVVRANRSFENADSGIAIFASNNIEIRNNLLLDNGNAGIRFSVGASNNIFANNTVDGAGKYGIFMFRGSDTPEINDPFNGRNTGNLIQGNVFRNTFYEGVKIKESDQNVIRNNVFQNINQSGTVAVWRFEDSQGNEVRYNNIQNTLFKIRNSSITFQQHAVQEDADSSSSVTYQ